MSDETDIECPPDSSSPSSPAAAAVPSSPPTPTKRAPSPPRWRFVNEAKSIYGYNSLSAGQVIQGKSAEDLAAKYVPPDISLYQPKKEEERVIGKLELSEEETAKEVELPKGEFSGLPSLEELIAKEPKKDREWDPKYHLPPKLIKDYSWKDADDMDDLYKACSESVDGSGREVGRLEFQSEERTTDDLTGQYNVMRKKDHTSTNTDDDCWQLALDSSWQLSECESETESVDNHKPGTGDESSTSSSNHENKPLEKVSIEEKVSEENSDQWNNKKTCRYSMILLMLLSIILLAALLGVNRDDNTKEVTAAATAFVSYANVTEVPSLAPSNYYPIEHPSNVPSSAPSDQCPIGMREFSVHHSMPISKDLHNATWELRDACTGELVSKCQPCSLGTLVFGNRSGRRIQMEVLQPTSECILLGREYSFRVFSTDDSDSCCGFDASSFVVGYDNQSYSIPDDALIQSDLDHTMYFGKGDEPCSSDAPSSSPSYWPTFKLTNDPSKSPTAKPTPVLTRPPSTQFPTNGCPKHYEPLQYYAIGEQIESGGIVYECIAYSCGSYGFEPGKEDSTWWPQGWSVIGTCDGTLPPTPNPTPRPTETSTTCTIKSGFNLCLALDNSGSVCNKFLAGECLFCQPSLFCQNLFSFLPREQCCQNYVDMVEFSKLMVYTLDNFFEADKSFSVVQFATSAQLASGLSTASETMDALDRMEFSGGATDHADAIRQCQASFDMSPDSNRQNFIMMITDGMPSTDYLNPDLAAEEEALYAKEAGTYIIPIFISENYDTYADSFMTSLSSDGNVFDVNGFESLGTLADALLDTVSCSSEL
jgi:hypothetical protein